MTRTATVRLFTLAPAGGVLALAPGACDDDSTAPDAPDPLAGGVVATFEVEGEDFKLWVTNEATIRRILDLEAGASNANIPNGPVLLGPGQGSHNAPFRWHLDPEETEMAELLSVEDHR